jgi:hypothetical protein
MLGILPQICIQLSATDLRESRKGVRLLWEMVTASAVALSIWGLHHEDRRTILDPPNLF